VTYEMSFLLSIKRTVPKVASKIVVPMPCYVQFTNSLQKARARFFYALRMRQPSSQFNIGGGFCPPPIPGLPLPLFSVPNIAESNRPPLLQGTLPGSDDPIVSTSNAVDALFATGEVLPPYASFFLPKPLRPDFSHTHNKDFKFDDVVCDTVVCRRALGLALPVE